MFCTALLTLAFAADPKPRLDRDGEPLPQEAVQRLGSLRFLVNNFTAATFSPDGKAVYTVSAVASDTSPALVAWEVPSGKKLWQTAVGRELFRIAADPDGKSVWAIAVGCNADDEFTVDRLRFSAVDGKEKGKVSLGERGLDVQVALHPSGRVAHWEDDIFEERWTLRLTSPDGETTLTQHYDCNKYGCVRDTEWSPAADRLYVITRVNSNTKIHQLAVNASDGKTLWEHSKEGWCEWRVTPDGKRLVGCLEVVAMNDERAPPVACCWDAATGNELGRLEIADLRRPSSGLDFERAFHGHIFLPPDGKTVFLRDWHDHTHAIDMATWKTVPTKQSFPEQTHFSPDGRSYLAPWGRHVGMYDTATGKRLSPYDTGFSSPESSVDLRFSSDSRRVVRTGWGYHPQLEWSIATGQEIRRTPWKEAALGTERGVSDYRDINPDGVCLSPDGTKRAQREQKDGEWRILVMLSDKPNAPPVVLDVPIATSSRPYQELLFTPDSRHLIGYHEGTGLHVWDTSKDGKPNVAKSTDSGHTGPTHPRHRLELSPDGRRAAALEHNGPAIFGQFVSGKPNWTISIFDVPSAKLVHSHTGEGGIASFGWTGQGELAGVVDRTPRNQFSFGKETPKFELIYLDPDAKEKRVHIPEAIPTCFAASPVGGTVAIGSKDGLRLYEARTGQVLHTYREQKQPVDIVAFSPDGRHLVAESMDGPLLVWDVRGDLTKPAKPDAAGWKRAWEALGSGDAAKGFRAVRLFALHPDGGVAELKRQFAEAKPTADEITTAIHKLDDRDFAVREQSERQLRAMGTAAYPALNKAMGQNPSAEFQERAGRVLVVEVPADRRRAERAVEALRLANTESARKQLTEWAKGPDKDPLTVAAKRK